MPQGLRFRAKEGEHSRDDLALVALPAGGTQRSSSGVTLQGLRFSRTSESQAFRKRRSAVTGSMSQALAQSQNSDTSTRRLPVSQL